MLEKEIEKHFTKVVKEMGGKAFKFTSPSHRGVSDRIACLPDGSVWFVELKSRGGRLSQLQEVFAAEMGELKQKYRCFWNVEQINQWSVECRIK